MLSARCLILLLWLHRPCGADIDGKPSRALSSAGEGDRHSGVSVSTLSLRTIPQALHTSSPVKLLVIGRLPQDEHSSSSGPEWSVTTL